MEQSVPNLRHIKFRRRRIAQKKAYEIQNKTKVWNEDDVIFDVENIEIFIGHLHGSQNKLLFLYVLLIYWFFDAVEEVWRLRLLHPSVCLWHNIRN
jgi:hypothetical protein